MAYPREANEKNLRTPGIFSSIFNPRSVAVIGAPRGQKTGSMFLRGLMDQGYEGEIFPVNPHAESIEGLRAYPSLEAVPSDVELAIVLVPAADVLAVLRECGRKQVRVAVVHTSGFSEGGGMEGKKREEEIIQAGREMGMRIIGPNCMGIYHPAGKIAFFPGLPKVPGKIGMISQSGSLAILLSRLVEPLGMHFSKIVSSGNEIDMGSAEFLRYFGKDPETEVIGAYIEGVRGGQTFRQGLQEVSQKKRIVIWKAGRTSGGSRAAFSHTGSLVGSRRIWEGLRKQVGIPMARNLDEFVDFLLAAQYLPPAGGRRLAILSGPGGPAVSAADACEEFGLEVADLAPGTREQLKRILPASGTSVRNPVDLGLSSVLQVDLYAEAAKVVGKDPNVDGLVFQGRGVTPALSLRYAQLLVEVKGQIRKPFLAVALGGLYLEQEARDVLTRGGIPVYPSAERALWAYANLYRFV